MDHRVELLAPAGGPEGFWGAICAGADAVYLGGERFGARAYADNFTEEELLDCIRCAHILGRKVYLAVNTLVKETEFHELFSYVQPFYEAGLDGVIVQDLGVFVFLREHFPLLALHVSTQMTLTGQYGAAYLKKLGADRVVPARELSLDEIIEIKRTTGVEVETFIHGAMCYCYSGQCLFSSILGGRSGNRGRCAQPCRLPYLVERKGNVSKECYPLSLKDMCTIERLPELIEAGIDSFKIEGRMKKPEYTAGVTAIYRKYIDKYYSDAGKWTVDPEDMEALAKLYIRSERQDGYYFRHNGRDMVTLDNPSYSANDEELLREVRSRYLTERPRLRIGVCAEFKVGMPAKVQLFLKDGPQGAFEGKSVTVCGEEVSRAVRQPITEENVRKQLGKFGDTLFEAVDMMVTVDADAFYPLKGINELRRQATWRLEEMLITGQGFTVRREDAIAPDFGNASGQTAARTKTAPDGGFHISVRSLGQLETVKTWLWENANQEEIRGRGEKISRIYVNADLLAEDGKRGRREQALQCCRKVAELGCKVVIALPPVLRKRDDSFLETFWEIYHQHRELFAGIQARSVDGFGFLAERSFGKENEEEVYADAGLYIWNGEALRGFGEPAAERQLAGFCMPYELNAAEQHRLLEKIRIPCEKVVYGRIPLMVTANCIAGTVDGCGEIQEEEIYYLTDRYRKRFPVLRSCGHCMNTIYNCVPLSLHGELKKWRQATDFRLDLTVEDEGMTREVLDYFLGGAYGDPPYKEYTTGHEKRGVE